MISLVAFDLWKTLAYRNVAYSTTEMILEKTGAEIPKEKFVKIFEKSLQIKVWKSKFAAYKNLCIKMGLKPTKENITLIMGIRDTAEAKAKLYPYTIPLLRQLKQNGLKTAILSNSSVFQYDWIKNKTKLLDYIDYPVFSFQVGAIKPSQKIFRYLLSKSRFKPSEILMVGDKTRDDVIPARSIGMHAILFKNYGQLKSDFGSLSIYLK